jgi:hypothetical protein
MNHLKTLFVKAGPAVRPALMTALFTFVAVFGAALTGWLTEVIGWLEAVDAPEQAEFPDPSVLGKAAVAGVVAAASGLVNFAVRWAQVMLGKGSVPVYEKHA